MCLAKSILSRRFRTRFLNSTETNSNRSMAREHQMKLYLLGETPEPQWFRPATPALNPLNSSFWYSITPTHTYANAPDDIEVLLVPGGPGARYLDITTQLEFIKKTYPKVKYLITICTGAGVAARA